jgi:hypothetical protein
MLRFFPIALLACIISLPVVAQPLRNFNANVLRGEVSFGSPPEISLNGDRARLAPGARIRGTDNLLKLPATLAGQRTVVNYTLEPGGLVLDMWLLTPLERARKPWPQTEAQARSWIFNPSEQTWTKP